MIDLASEARHPILIVNDSDISVPAGYIGSVTAPLSDPGVGLVTCLYRAEAHDWPSRLEALAIATDFAPSTLVAGFFGVSEFGLGSTLAFRKSDLDRIGGFHAIADYIADDYQLGRKLHALGLRNVISEVVVSTHLAAGSWLGAWRHQVRWARTIRLSGGAGYAGLPITNASLWAAMAPHSAGCGGSPWRCLRSGSAWPSCPDGCCSEARMFSDIATPSRCAISAAPRSGPLACLGTRWSGAINSYLWTPQEESCRIRKPLAVTGSCDAAPPVGFPRDFFPGSSTHHLWPGLCHAGRAELVHNIGPQRSF